MDSNTSNTTDDIAINSDGHHDGDDVDPFNEDYYAATFIWVHVVAFLLLVVAVLCVVGSWLFVYYYRKQPIVAMSQPIFLYYLCFGALLLPLSYMCGIIPSLSNLGRGGGGSGNGGSTRIRDHVWCNIAGWLGIMSIMIVFSALLCKVYRVKKIAIDAPLQRGLKVLPKHVFWPFILVVSTTIGLLLAWTVTVRVSPFIRCTIYHTYNYYSAADVVLLFLIPALYMHTTYCSVLIYNCTNSQDPQKFKIEEVSEDDMEVILGYCKWPMTITKGTITFPYAICIQIVYSLLFLMLLVLACTIKKVNQELGDGKRILYLMAYLNILFQIINAVFLSSPHLEFHSSMRYVIESIFSFFYVLGIIGFMIAPRMYYIWYENKHGHLPDSITLCRGTITVRINTSTININPSPNQGAEAEVEEGRTTPATTPPLLLPPPPPPYTTERSSSLSSSSAAAAVVPSC